MSSPVTSLLLMNMMPVLQSPLNGIPFSAKKTKQKKNCMSCHAVAGCIDSYSIRGITEPCACLGVEILLASMLSPFMDFLQSIISHF